MLIYAARQGIRDAGAKDNEEVLIFSGLMDSKSLFLTANADTVYFLSNIDLSKGPMVVETPPDTLKIYPYVAGSYGTSIGTFVTGKGPLAPVSKPGALQFIEGTGLSMNTIPPKGRRCCGS